MFNLAKEALVLWKALCHHVLFCQKFAFDLHAFLLNFLNQVPAFFDEKVLTGSCNLSEALAQYMAQYRLHIQTKREREREREGKRDNDREGERGRERERDIKKRSMSSVSEGVSKGVTD